MSESKRKELQVGDQILEIASCNGLQMSHYEATELMVHAKEPLQLKVTQNVASELLPFLFYEHGVGWLNCYTKSLHLDTCIIFFWLSSICISILIRL